MYVLLCIQRKVALRHRCGHVRNTHTHRHTKVHKHLYMYVSIYTHTFTRCTLKLYLLRKQIRMHCWIRQVGVLAFIFGTNINNESRKTSNKNTATNSIEQKPTRKKRRRRRRRHMRVARKTSFIVLEHVRDRSQFAQYGAAVFAAAASNTLQKTQDTRYTVRDTIPKINTKSN